MFGRTTQSFHILLVEDNLGDIRLAQEALIESPIEGKLHITRNGDEALSFLRREGRFQGVPIPDLVLLDLNLPGMNGHEILQKIKEDEIISAIPVVVFSTSCSEDEVLRSYSLRANSHRSKPMEFTQYQETMKSILECFSPDLGREALPFIA
jgi:CheY-like chemotaxis protein